MEFRRVLFRSWQWKWQWKNPTTTSQLPASEVLKPCPLSEARSLVVCSLEPRGEVRRGVRILVDAIVHLGRSLPVLYVAPAVDIRHQLKQGKVADITGSRLHKVHARIHVLRPHRWVPPSVGPSGDRHLERQTLDAIGEIGLRKPLLWVNDPPPAPFAVRTGWPSLYKV